MASFFASNKDARDAFKSPPTKNQVERGFDAERLSKLTFTLEAGSKGFPKDTKDSHVAALKLLCAKFNKDDDEWTFPTEEELHPAAAELMKSGAKPDTPSMMLRKLSALQRALVETHPDTKIGMEANPTMMKRANWMLFGRTDWRDEPFRSADDFNESSTWSTFNVISEASGRSATKELAEEEKAKAMVGKEIVSTTNPTRAVDCHEILRQWSVSPTQDSWSYFAARAKMAKQVSRVIGHTSRRSAKTYSRPSSEPNVRMATAKVGSKTSIRMHHGPRWSSFNVSQTCSSSSPRSRPMFRSTKR